MTTLFPDVTVEFSPTTDPLDDPVWEDISSSLRSFSINRGRSRELDRAEAGIATIELDNHLGYFDPSKTDGPYYPNLRPMRRVRIQSVIPATWDPFTIGSSFVGDDDVLGGSELAIILFSGFVETWSQNWTPQPFPVPDATATIQAVDAFTILAHSIGVASTSGTSGLVVGAILDNIAWPSLERNLETGSFNISTVSASGGDVVLLSVLQEIDASEGGLFFVARDGTMTFYGANHVQMNPPAEEQLWGDATGERQYQSVTLATDESVVWNDVLVTSPYAPLQGRFEDRVSQDRYLRRTVTLSTVLQSAAEMQTRGWDYIGRFSTPRRRITSMEVGVRDDVEWTDILSHDLLDRILVRRRPIRGETGIEQDSVIQGISIKSESRFRWSVVWTLSATPSVNQLTNTQSSFESGTTGWAAESNCTIASVSSGLGFQANYGTSAMQMTATGNGDMSALTSPNTQLGVSPGNLYSAMAGFFNLSTAHACRVELVWRNSGGTILSSISGNVTPIGVTGYQNSAVSGIAPAGAAFATVRVVVQAASTGEVHYVDTVGFVEGEQTGWSVGMG